MRAEVSRINPEKPEPDLIAGAVTILRRGGLVAFPTETVYGLGANALDLAAVERIFVAKGRPARNPIIVHVADVVEGQRLVTQWPPASHKLAARFWPGPLTLVLPKNPIVPDIVTAGGSTVAIRMPAHPIALALIKGCGFPLAAPSANASSQLSPTKAEHVVRGLQNRIDLILDGGPTSGGLESTVLDLTGPLPRLLRPGLVSGEDIEKVIGPIIRGSSEKTGTGPLSSPGLLARHYAPQATLECVEGNGLARVIALVQQKMKVGWLIYSEGPDRHFTGEENLLTTVMPSDPTAYAAQLYAVLHNLDEKRVVRIVVEMPPDTEPWRAVRDRLRRASCEGG